MLMAASGGLIMLFLGLEIMSIALYVMAAFHRRRLQSGEAGFKYFILGSFSSAIFLYGVALVYGATGSTQFNEMADLPGPQQPPQQRGAARRHGPAHRGTGLQGGGRALPLLDPRRLPGVADPVHRLHGGGRQGGRLRRPAPRARRGAHQPAGQLAAGHLGHGRADAPGRVGPGLAQKDLKRMLAYSSISQAGYVLVGVQAASATARPAPSSTFSPTRSSSSAASRWSN